MPIYVYDCLKCKNTMEIFSSYDKLEEIEKTLKCDKCGSALRRKLAPFVSHFNFTRGQ